MVTSVTQGETKTELWHQCSVAEPKRWALWDEGVVFGHGVAVIGTKSPRKNTCIWTLCMFLVLKFGPWFLTRFALQSVGPQPLQDTTSKALAKEMVPAFQPLCPAGLLHPMGLMMEHEMGTWLSPGSQSSARPVVLCPSELPRGNLPVLITLQD